jgi:hypothetical protein
MEPRKLRQYGWVSGPVECRCSGCDWSASFIATNSSIPVHIMNAFEDHKCRDYATPHQVQAAPVLAAPNY